MEKLNVETIPELVKIARLLERSGEQPGSGQEARAQEGRAAQDLASLAAAEGNRVGPSRVGATSTHH